MPDEHEEYEHLQRKRIMRHDGTWILANTKHIEQVLELLDMHECKEAPTPAVKCKKELLEDMEELAEVDKEIYRRCVGILLYIAHDRHDSGASASWPSTSRRPRWER